MNSTIQGRIGFYASSLNSFHDAILDPIQRALSNEKRIVTYKTASLHHMVRFRPDIIILAEHHDGFFHQALPSAMVIMTRHGFSTKNYLGSSMNWYDIFCVSSPWVQQEYASKQWLPQVAFAVTGFPALDHVLPSSQKQNSNLFPDRGPVLLYAPTGTPSLSSATLLGNQWLARLREQQPELNVIIKPHPHAPENNPDWMAMWRSMVEQDPKAHLVEDTHTCVYNYFPSADILMTDASSVMFYFLAFNRPLILVNNPERFRDPHRFDSQAHEWQWRDMGIEIDSPDQLADAVDRCLQNPNEKSTLREQYRQRVFGNQADGNAAHRIANLAIELLYPSKAQKQATEHGWTIIANRCVKLAQAAIDAGSQ